MRKFNKPTKSFSDKKKPAFRSKPGAYKKDSESAERGEKNDKEGYKPKRSFSKDRDYKSKDGHSKSRTGYGSSNKSGDYKEKRPFDKSSDRGEKKEYKPFAKREGGDFKEKRSFGEKKEYKGIKKDFKPFVKREDGDSDKPKFRKKKPFGDKKEPEKLSYKAKRSFTKNKELREGGGFFKKDSDTFFGKKEFDVPGELGSEKKAGRFSAKADSFGKGKSYDDKKPFKRNDKYKAKSEGSTVERKSYKKDVDAEGEFVEKRFKHDEFEEGKTFSGSRGREFSKEKRFDKKSAVKSKSSDDGLTRLNKYLANAGIASRREADTLIKSGVVKVNGVPVVEMGYKIKPGDTVTYGDAAVKSERKVYLLLNKPKDYITTMDDPQERKTVMSLVSGACRERIYPVGRLDRNTTGLLLFTNDGELTKKLTHPKHEIKKVYHVSINKALKPDDFKAIVDGIELEDGPIHADDLAFVGEGKKEIGIEVHSGRNRIIRRIFEHLGYEVLKLDRVTFASLTKKDLPRGKHRFLTPKEVNFLQMIG